MASALSSSRPAEDHTRRRRVEATREVLRTLDRAIKTALLYPRASSVVEQLHSEFAERMGGLLETYGTLSLTVVCDEVYLDDEWVYDGGQDERNFAFTLFDSGIKELVFHSDVRTDELRTFVRLLQIAVAGQRDDLATLLWERSLSHIGFVTVDVIAEPWSPDDPDRDPGNGCLRDRLRDRSLSLEQIARLEPAGVRDVEEEDEQEDEPYLLRREEIDALIARVQTLRNAPLLAEASDVLWTLVHTAVTPAELAAPLQWLADLVPLLADHGQLGPLVETTRHAREIARRADLDPAIRTRCEQVVKAACTPTVATLVRQHVERAHAFEALQRYLLALGADAIGVAPYLLDHPKLRPHVVEAVRHGCSGDATPLRAFFHHEDEATALLAIDLGAPRLGIHAQTELIHATAHLSPRVRAAAYRALCAGGNLRGLEHAIAGIDDPTATVRNQTLRALLQRLRHPVPELHPPLRALADDRGFAARPEREQVTIVALLVRADPSIEIPSLRRSLLRRRWWFAGRRRRQRWRIEVAALERAATDPALELLEELSERGHRRLRTLAREALERTARSRQERRGVTAPRMVRILRAAGAGSGASSRPLPTLVESP
ncbi:MAG: hypothetical protein D6776_00085 [Planctomycetota bacterium]|nr:MAG: hypothetical protein D6776_00085 [Planctomycetota bacterium]